MAGSPATATVVKEAPVAAVIVGVAVAVVAVGGAAVAIVESSRPSPSPQAPRWWLQSQLMTHRHSFPEEPAKEPRGVIHSRSGLGREDEPRPRCRRPVPQTDPSRKIIR